MGRFNGRYRKGFMQQVREEKRLEAEVRNEEYQERQAEIRERVRVSREQHEQA